MASNAGNDEIILLFSAREYKANKKAREYGLYVSGQGLCPIDDCGGRI
jgi:hypothetical protein